MNGILTLDVIPQAGLERLSGEYEVGNDTANPAEILLRSSELR